MEAMEAVKAAAAAAGMAESAIGPALGRSRQYSASISSRGRTPRADTLADLLAACGYTLAAVPAAGELPAGSLVIDSPTLGAGARREALRRERDEAAARLAELDAALAALEG